MKAAFYKGTKPGLAALFDIGVHKWEAGDYAHVELILSDGRAASSTFLEGGVRMLPAGGLDVSNANDWDFVELPGFDEQAAIAWFEKNDGAKYDTWGDAHFVIGFIRESKKKYFCSEAVGAALGFQEPWRLDPNALFVVLNRFLSYPIVQAVNQR